MNLSSINLRFFANIAPLVTGLNKAERALDQAGRKMQATGKKLTMQLTAPIAGMGAIAVNTFQAFELQMAKVKAVSGATAEEFKALEADAQRLGLQPFSARHKLRNCKRNLQSWVSPQKKSRKSQKQRWHWRKRPIQTLHAPPRLLVQRCADLVWMLTKRRE